MHENEDPESQAADEIEAPKPEAKEYATRAPGLYPDLPMEEYHSSGSISKSGLDLIRKSPLHYWELRGKADPEDDDTDSLELGRQVHTCALEPHVWERDFAWSPHSDKRTTKYKNWAVANAHRQIITKTRAMQVEAMARAVHAHRKARQLLAGTLREASIYWIDEDTDVLCKCRPDSLDTSDPHCWIVADLKTARSANPDDDEFPKAAWNQRYHWSAAFTIDGIRAMLRQTGKPVPEEILYVPIAVETKPPHAVSVFVFNTEIIREGREEYRKHLQTYADCKAANAWPGYPENFHEIGLPRFKRGKKDD